MVEKLIPKRIEAKAAKFQPQLEIMPHQDLLPKTAIEVVDSKTVESSELLIVLEAARTTRQGKNFNEIIQIVNNMIPRMN